MMTGTQASAASCTSLTKFLSRGSENNEVLSLQQFLYEGSYLLVKPNGYFGENTKKAVIAFQKNKNISTTGAVGPLTRAKINELSCNNATNQKEGSPSNSAAVPTPEKEKNIVVDQDQKVVTPVYVTPPVTTPVTVPTIYVKTFLATDVTSETATLKGSGGVEGEKHWFQWGNTMDMKNETPQIATSINYSHALTGLTPNTAYYFRAVTSIASSSDRKAETAYGEMRYFTTPAKVATAATKVAPTVTITSTGVAVNAEGSAKVTWTSSGVTTCSFTQGEAGGSWTQQSSLSGQYITRPMTTSAVFGINCKEIGGYTVTGSVTVPKITK